MNGLIAYFSDKLKWRIDIDDFDDIEDLSYEFSAEDIGLKEESFARIKSLRQLPPLVDGQRWGIFCVEFDSKRFEVTALRKILSGLIPTRRNSAEHAVWDKKDLLFLCFWGLENERTIGIAHFQDKDNGLPQIKMISCAPSVEDFTQIQVFEKRLAQLKWPNDYLDHEKWASDWSEAFVTGYRQTIRDAATLTSQLAKEAQNIRNRILDTLAVESSNGYVHLLFEKFKNTLIHDMKETEFADMYAQTVVYGLFSARCMDDTQEDFSAGEAIDCIPLTNPFLKSLMKDCLESRDDSKLFFDELEIDNVVELLKHATTALIIQDFNRQTGGGKEDPVIHFYEDFLNEYDKKQKVQRGVYYTPQPVVDFIIRAVDYIIKEDFGYEDGLASTETKKVEALVEKQNQHRGSGAIKLESVTYNAPAIQILDPATGTGTFIRQCILQIFETFRNNNMHLNEEDFHTAWNEYVPKHLLPRLNAYELMMAPYAVAHMKLAMVLKDTGYDFKNDSRLNVFLTNTLEEAGDSRDQLSFWNDPLALESISANRVKKNKGINIVIGNPPYSAESANKGVWIDSLMETYKKEADGKTKLREKNSKPLNDDYIKFIRYAQFLIEKQEQGLLAFINPHGFMDGPIFRGMRSSLMRTFDKLYILDLHGNTNRHEVSPDGSKDENVFDIKQGVCILIAVKNQKPNNQKATVYKADLWGLREDKNVALSNISFEDIQWQELFPEMPMHLFVKENINAKRKYEEGFSVKELFLVNGTGVLTKRDALCIHFTPDKAFEAAEDLLTKPSHEVIEKYRIPNDVRDWKYDWAKTDVASHGLKSSSVRPITYRPFDVRYTYYTGQTRGFMGWPVYAVMQHIINTDNLALVTARSNKTGDSTHFFVSSNIVEYKCGERTTNSSVFPLYLMGEGDISKSPNMNESVINAIENKLGLTFCCEKQSESENEFDAYDLFAFIYAILYSNRYRKIFKAYLNRDFPRIPYADKKTFISLNELGKQLIRNHLLRVEENNDYIAFFGDNYCVEKVSFDKGKVYINKTSYFSFVSQITWEQIIGGYQPCQRWLKERKGRVLSQDDIHYYASIINSLNNTQKIMVSIDEITRELF